MRVNWGQYGLPVLITIGLSCAGKQEDRQLISKTEMADIIIKTYLVEAKVKQGEVSADSAALLLSAFKRQLLKQKEVTDSTLTMSYAYYMSNPKEMGEIMDIVVDTLSLHEQRLKAEQDTSSLISTQ